MKTTPIPGPEYLNECFEYRDGALYWKPRPLAHFRSVRARAVWNAIFPGKRAGRQMAGRTPYRQVGIEGRRLLEHRVIAAMHGLPLDAEVDHIDGDAANNRIENLRPATHSQNMRNTTGWATRADRVGVFRVKGSGSWIAYIRCNGRHTHLGTFATEGEAIRARRDAERREYGQYAGAASRPTFQKQGEPA